jgi:hypothetical protein
MGRRSRLPSVSGGARLVVEPIAPEIAAVAVQFPSNFPKKILPTGSIAATAFVEGAPLVTADERMR